MSQGVVSLAHLEHTSAASTDMLREGNHLYCNSHSLRLHDHRFEKTRRIASSPDDVSCFNPAIAAKVRERLTSADFCRAMVRPPAGTVSPRQYSRAHRTIAYGTFSAPTS